ncbi:MAG TPA: porin family protein [Puia sp.]|jgi:hypothetical protein|nr:porin family protein [Puia sp.]
MKKLALVLFSAISFATAHAQFQIGAKAGANFSTVTSSSQFTDPRTLFNFNAGFWVKLPVAPGLSVQPEIFYSGQGAGYTDQGIVGHEHFNYIDVPFLLKFAHRSGLYAETGPQVAFLVSANDKYQGTTTDIKAYVNSTEFAWVFGFGYKVPVSPFGIDFRYNLGISNVQNNSISGTNETVRNSVFQIGLTYVLWSSGRR